MALANPGVSRSVGAQQLTDDILALANKDAQPSRQTVLDFAGNLGAALAGKLVAAESTKPVTQAIAQLILDVLQSSSMPSSRFHATIASFRNALIAFNVTAVQAKAAEDRLLILGQEVRGPEDVPVQIHYRLLPK